MADKSSHAERLTRAEAADRLQEIAGALREGDLEVETGNRATVLRPPEKVNLEVVVRESSSLLRGDRESVTVRMDWKPRR